MEEQLRDRNDWTNGKIMDTGRNDWGTMDTVLLKTVHIHDDLKIMMWWLYMYYGV